VRALAVGLVLGTVALAGPTAPPSPGLRTASSTNPVPPTNVTVTPTDRALTVSWTAAADTFVTGYRVYLDNTLKASPTGTSATIGSLVNGRSYSVTVTTVSTLGIAHEGTTSTAALPGVPRDSVAPAAPAGVSATRGDTRVDVAWVANAADYDVDGYRVLRDGSPLTSLLSGQATTAFVDTAVVNDTTYSYTVQTHDTSGNWSASSVPAVSATPTDLTAPAVPTALSALRGDGQVTLQWAGNPETDLAHYAVLRNGVEVGTASGLTYTDPGLSNDTTYSYTLVAIDTHGNRSGASSPAVSATPTDLTAPDAPTGLTAEAGDGSVSLLWAASPEQDLGYYAVLRNGVQVGTATGLAYADGGLTNDTTYSYSLVAVDTHGNRSTASTPAVSARPTDLTAPNAPTGLAAVAGDGRVRLTWAANAETDLADYRVLRDGVEVATVAGTSYTDNGVTNEQTYSYTLVAVDTHGNESPESAPVEATPTDTPPDAPTGLAAVPGDTQVELNWTANTEPDLAGYRVLRNGVEIAAVSGTSFTDTGLTDDTTYTYTVVAVDALDHRSVESAPVDAMPTDQTAPDAPAGLAALAGDSHVALTWTANAEADVVSYVVLRDGAEIATVPAGDTGSDDAGLANDTSYSYTVVALDGHGNRSPESDPVEATPTDLTAPAAPVDLQADAGDGQVRLIWTANTESDLAYYTILRDGVEVDTVTGADYTDTGLTDDTTYSYTVIAVDTHGNRSPESASAVATPTDTTPPDAPADLVATAGDTQVSLSWTANAEPDVAGYVVLRDGVQIATVPGTDYVDAGLDNGTTYSYTLIAVDSSGNRSVGSAPADATPTDLPPVAPTGVTATPGDGRAVLGWAASPETDVVEYRVLDENGAVVATVADPGLRATITGLTNGTSYPFTVVAVDAGGNVSAESAAVSVVPAPATVPTTGAGETGGLAASSDGRFVVIGTRAQREASDTNTAYELYLLDRTAGTARRIAPLTAKATGATDPTNTAAPAISDDGRYIALATTAALVPADTNKLADVYRLDTSTGIWALVSVPAGGTVSRTVAGTMLLAGPSVYAKSPSVVLSGDGDLVLFYSARADLVAKDTNNVVDVFAKRMSTGAVTRVSTTATGASMARAASGPALAVTPDGRFALFPATTVSGVIVLYRKTLSGADAGALIVASSLAAPGKVVDLPVFRDVGDVAISDDGRYVALVTAAKVGTTTPTANWTTGLAYRVDTTDRSFVALGSGQHAVWEHEVELDPAGRFAFFATAAAALPADKNGHTDHYRRDLDGGGPLVLVTANAAGVPTLGPSGSVASTEYGRLFAVSGDEVLLTTSQALAPADANKVRDLYLKDLADGSVGSPVR
jgi:chitodextrinase